MQGGTSFSGAGQAAASVPLPNVTGEKLRAPINVIWCLWRLQDPSTSPARNNVMFSCHKGAPYKRFIGCNTADAAANSYWRSSAVFSLEPLLWVHRSYWTLPAFSSGVSMFVSSNPHCTRPDDQWKSLTWRRQSPETTQFVETAAWTHSWTHALRLPLNTKADLYPSQNAHLSQFLQIHINTVSW